MPVCFPKSLWLDPSRGAQEVVPVSVLTRCRMTYLLHLKRFIQARLLLRLLLCHHFTRPEAAVPPVAVRHSCLAQGFKDKRS